LFWIVPAGIERTEAERFEMKGVELRSELASAKKPEV
jgi:hypothetical protein